MKKFLQIMCYIYAALSILIGIFYACAVLAYGVVEYYGVKNLPKESILDIILFFIINVLIGTMLYKLGKYFK